MTAQQKNVNKADINPAVHGHPDLPLDVMGLFFFAYRDFTGDADALLDRQGFGRAHHRVLYFVNLRPGMPVADLLDILKITKQSLARVLRQLIDNGYIEQLPVSGYYTPPTGGGSFLPACPPVRRAASMLRLPPCLRKRPKWCGASSSAWSMPMTTPCWID